MLKRFPTAFAVCLGLLLLAPPVRAAQSPSTSDQTTSTEQATAASKADPGTATPDQATDQPRGVQKVRNYIEKSPIVQKLKGDGIYPRIGGLSPGSGLAGGVGYRRHLDWAFVDVSGAVSTKAYRGVDATLGWINTKYVEVSTKLTFRNNTQDDFYGLGIDSTDAERVDFGIRSTDLSTRAAAHVTPWLRLGADVGYYVPSVRHGRDDSLRTIESIFTDATAPGLAQQPDFVHESVFAEVDSRDAHGFPRRGGFYRAAYALWNDRTLEEFNFRRFDVIGSHFMSVARNDVVAVRLELSYANNAPGDRVPFYLLPYVGGGDTVRSFREFRFRDENAGVFGAELRHKVHPMAHIAGFVDFGTVARDWQDINPHHVKNAYGIGLRGGSDDKTYVRFDVAHGDGGTRVFLKFTPSF
jgi:opacity protein-like surface antigen